MLEKRVEMPKLLRRTGILIKATFFLSLMLIVANLLLPHLTQMRN